MNVCELLDIENGSARAFRISEQLEIFIVRQGEHIFGYHNSCPHTGAPLNWLADQFLDYSRAYIQCSGHDALFRIEDGCCISGPCHGQSLLDAKLTVVNGRIIYEP
jgi:nitrite reductase/ring-hydroxylating ferredoxin subunit